MRDICRLALPGQQNRLGARVRRVTVVLENHITVRLTGYLAPAKLVPSMETRMNTKSILLLLAVLLLTELAEELLQESR